MHSCVWECIPKQKWENGRSKCSYSNDQPSRTTEWLRLLEEILDTSYNRQRWPAKQRVPRLPPQMILAMIVMNSSICAHNQRA
mmetsp:Transcript_12399/g.20102  ORF Transcript_12399/g.20102 Transcript_12399/m.20102 type:complete len:83 (+) Transcript_12399:559-807(+)